jgi:CdiI immunity protein
MTHDLSVEVEYPSLWLFFAGYMYQSWHDEFPDEWAVADAFVRDEPLSATNFRAEMNELLSRHTDEPELRRILLDDFGAAAMVENRGWKYRDWLEAMADHVEKAVGRSQAS